MKKKELYKQRDANDKKADLMVEKFIKVLENIDTWKRWECIMLEAIMLKLQKENDLDGFISTLEIDFGFRVLKTDSLVQEMKIDAFIEQMKDNPYQLKLVS